MTNREMAKGAAAAGPRAAPAPDRQPAPPMPAPEGSPGPTTDREPVDSPQPNASVKRAPPDAEHGGLATERGGSES